MNEGPSSNVWWQTLPGILTATTGIITAVASLMVVLNQAGFFERESQRPPHVKEDVPTPPNSTGSSQASTSTTVPKAPTVLIPQVAGTWEMHQTGSPELLGTLTLIQEGRRLRGKLVWKTLDPAEIVDGQVSGEQLTIIVQYPKGVEGTYTGTLESPNRLNGDYARGGGATAGWHAIRR